jgi:hypothetical protein
MSCHPEGVPQCNRETTVGIPCFLPRDCRGRLRSLAMTLGYEKK